MTRALIWRALALIILVEAGFHRTSWIPRVMLWAVAAIVARSLYIRLLDARSMRRAL